MKMRRGISLIVLVITIIIIIILAGAVILNLADNNPIENASEAQIMSDLDTFNSDLTVQIGNKYLEPNGTLLTAKDIDSDELRDGWKLLDLVPSIKGTGYEEYLAVVDSKLVLKEGIEIDNTTKEIIESKLGKAMITPEMIKADAQKYIGAEVLYVGDNQPEGTKWRIFNITEDGTIQLITDSYVNLEEYKGTTPATNIVVNGYSISASNNRDTLINYLANSNNWSEYAVSGKTIAKGAATIEEFCSSYKLKYPAKYLEYAYTTADSTEYITSGAKADGYVLRFNENGITDDWYYEKSVGTADDLYVKTKQSYGEAEQEILAYWLSSFASLNAEQVIGAAYYGTITQNFYNNTSRAIRPLVSLTSNVSIVE